MKYAALLGYGTVGGGVARLLERNAARITAAAGEPIQLKYILVRRDFPGDEFAARMVRDFARIEADADVSIVIETMGGTGAAYEYTRRALMAGKCVVTANKELVATHGAELFALAREHDVCYLCEASVGGGIPVLRPLTQCLAANEIDEVCGIVNGTTNYILTQMLEEGASYADALAAAQQAGYAEADPTADVEGLDAGRKLCILAGLAFGASPDPAALSTQGITAVALEDAVYARELGYRLKLVARAVRGEDGSITAYVAPQLVDEANPLAQLGGVTNGVRIHGDAVGWVTLTGPGAGRYPTASAVVADVIDAAKAPAFRPGYAWSETARPADPAELPSRWYIRREGEASYITEPLPASALPAPDKLQAVWRVLT